MANDVKWIKLMVGMFDGESFKKIKKAEIGGVKFRDKLTAVWFELMDFAGRCNHNGAFINNREIPYVNLSDIAVQIDREEEELELCMQFFINEGMVTIIDDVFMLSNWSEYQNIDGMDRIRSQTRLRVAKHREKQKLLLSNVTGNATVTDGNAPDKDIDKDIDIDIDIDIDKKNTMPTKADIASFFESIWKLYPNKKGKGQVSESKRKALYEIGFDEIRRAVDRYLKDLEKDASWRKPQNGSTFFNSGYVDYLDANYSPAEGENEGSGSDGTATGDNGQTLYGHYV